MTRRQLLRALELELVQPVPLPPAPPVLTRSQGLANLRALADALGPRVWAQHQRAMRREGHWALVDGWDVA